MDKKDYTWLKFLIVAFYPIMLGGCASTLYVYPHSDETEVESVQTHVQYLQATRHSYMLGDGLEDSSPFMRLLLQLTPLGLIAPAFGAPTKHISYEASIHLTGPEYQLTKESIRSEPGKTETFSFNLNDRAQAKLRETGRATFYDPDSVNISITCDKRSCTASAEPPIVKNNGTLEVKAREVEDKGRLAEIVDEATARRVRVEQEEAEKTQRMNALVLKYGKTVTRKATLTLQDKVGNESAVVTLVLAVAFPTLDITGKVTVMNLSRGRPQNLFAYGPIIAYNKDGRSAITFYPPPPDFTETSQASNFVVNPGEQKTRVVNFSQRLINDGGSGGLLEGDIFGLKLELVKKLLEGSRSVGVSVNPNGCNGCSIFFDFSS